MIKLTRINGAQIVVNAEFVETLASTPETLVTLNTGKTVRVKDSIDDVIQKVTAYKKEINGKLTVVRKEPDK